MSLNAIFTALFIKVFTQVINLCPTGISLWFWFSFLSFGSNLMLSTMSHTGIALYVDGNACLKFLFLEANCFLYIPKSTTFFFFDEYRISTT